MNKLDELDSRNRQNKILDGLPSYLQSRWRTKAVDWLDKHGSYPDIESLADFLDKVAREANDPVFGALECRAKDNQGKFSGGTRRSRGSNFNVQVNDRSDTTERVRQVNATEGSRGNRHLNTVNLKCYLCNGNHILRRCKMFAILPCQKRLEKVKEIRLCFNYLDAKNHRARWCKSPSACGLEGCTVKHSKLLHYALIEPVKHMSGQSSSSVTRQMNSVDDNKQVDAVKSLSCSIPSEGMKIALPIVAVWVRAPNQNEYIRTHALLDTGHFALWLWQIN